MRLYLKNNKELGALAQEAEQLSSKWKALSSNSSIASPLQKKYN
jgi:hypothetical protein